MIILGLGCNIGDRLANLRIALQQLSLNSSLKIQRVSPVYESDALLLPEAPEEWNLPFLNLAIKITTTLTPEQLLKAIKDIEVAMGRVAKFKWSPRVIDIDILTWGSENYRLEGLTIPHRSLLERPFALWPLADLEPSWRYCGLHGAQVGKTAEYLATMFGSRFDGKAPLGTRQLAHRVDTPYVMGIVNLTTDSFSDGGKYLDLAAAYEQVQLLFESGADVIDVGAEATGPEVIKAPSVEEEWRRLQPFLDRWNPYWQDKRFRPKLSVDTRRPQIIERLLPHGVDIYNIIQGLDSSTMVDLLKESTAKIIYMHSLGLPGSSKMTLSDDADVVPLVYAWGARQLESLIAQGIGRERLIFDLGIGFGKNSVQSMELLRNIEKFHELGVRILVGHSRKSFLNRYTNLPPGERDIETAALSWHCHRGGVSYLRVHNVDYTLRVLKMLAAVM